MAVIGCFEPETWLAIVTSAYMHTYALFHGRGIAIHLSTYNSIDRQKRTHNMIHIYKFVYTKIAGMNIDSNRTHTRRVQVDRRGGARWGSRNFKLKKKQRLLWQQPARELSERRDERKQ